MPVRRINHYRPNPQNRLDVAVGKIVNQMPVPISLEPASEEDHRISTWQDEVGHYVLSDPSEPLVEPKMIFCRILRSRMVMVRIGGGWQELSNFITQRFAGDVEMFEAGGKRAPRLSSSSDVGNDSIASATSSMLLTPSPNKTHRASSAPWKAISRSSTPDPQRTATTPEPHPRAAITPTPLSRHAKQKTPSVRASTDSKIPFPALSNSSKPVAAKQ